MEENVTLKVGDIFSQPLSVVKPGEMLKIDLSHSQLRQLKDDNEDRLIGAIGVCGGTPLHC